jgi:hypothetical protein
MLYLKQLFLLNLPQNKSWKVKEKLVSKPILQYPDFTKDLILTTDASVEGLGAIISQGRNWERLTHNLDMIKKPKRTIPIVREYY